MCLLLLAVLGRPGSRGVTEFGTSPGIEGTAPALSEPTTQPPMAVPAGEVPVAGGGLPRATAGVAPQRLQIPAIGLDAAVVPVGLDRGGELRVPQRVQTVGWYRYGPDLRTAAGSVVVAGHVDGAAQGEGAFFRLRDLRPGARVTVIGDDGAERTFTVVSREVFGKTEAPLDRLFARDGPARLTLITCGGTFDEDSRRYRDNVVVTAVPA